MSTEPDKTFRNTVLACLTCFVIGAGLTFAFYSVVIDSNTKATQTKVIALNKQIAEADKKLLDIQLLNSQLENSMKVRMNIEVMTKRSVENMGKIIEDVSLTGKSASEQLKSVIASLKAISEQLKILGDVITEGANL